LLEELTANVRSTKLPSSAEIIVAGAFDNVKEVRKAPTGQNIPRPSLVGKVNVKLS